jgi:1-acyl-sn-glycerol-3-phosphate acyltransferase
MTEARAPAGFALRRRGGIASISRRFMSAVLTYHRIRTEGTEHLPRQGPALLLPKHCAYRDIPIEGVILYRETRRYANYVMKMGLWGVFELLGGVKIVRPKDIRRLKDREAKREEIRRARRANQRTLDYLAWLYSRGEVIVSHPEGMRYQKVMGPIQKEIIEHLLQVEEQLGASIPLIPIGIQYESYWRPGARVFFRVGEALRSAQFAGAAELASAVGEQLRRLSGFTY